MTLNEFINRWAGKSVDFDGKYPGQCVDLVKFWQQNIGGSITRGNGVDFARNYGSDYQYIPNSLLGVPQPGDIVVWGNKPYGHVAIFISGNWLGFKSFDANYPLGSRPHVQSHNYRNVIGWLRLKKYSKSTNGVYPTNNKDMISRLYNMPNGKVVLAVGEELWHIKDPATLDILYEGAKNINPKTPDYIKDRKIVGDIEWGREQLRKRYE